MSMYKKNLFFIVLLCIFNFLQADITVTPVTGSPFALSGGATFPQGIDCSPNGLFVATANTNTDNVSVFTVNQTTGFLTEVAGSPFTAGDGPEGVSFSPDNLFLAAANRNTNDVTVFTVNQTTGVLTEIAGSPFATGGTLPVVLDYSPDGRFLAVNNLAGGNIVTVFSVNQTTGFLTSIGDFATGGTTPHGLNYSPDGLFLAVANESTNNVTVFDVNQTTGALTTIAGSPFATGGSTARFPTYSPDGLFLAVTKATGGVTVFGVNQTTGALAPIAGSPFAGVDGPIGIRYSLFCPPDGLLLAVANLGVNGTTVTVYLANQTTGALTQLAGSPFDTGGDRPFGVCFTGGGLFLANTNRTSDDVTVFKLGVFDVADLSAVTNKNTPVTITLSGMSTTPQTFEIQQLPANGTLSAITPLTGPPNVTAEITYTPNDGFTGNDSFRYSFTNEECASTVTIAVLSGNPCIDLAVAIRAKYIQFCPIQ